MKEHCNIFHLIDFEHLKDRGCSHSHPMSWSKLIFRNPNHSFVFVFTFTPFVFITLSSFLLPIAPGVACGEEAATEQQPALCCAVPQNCPPPCTTQMVIMELHINWLCWKLTVAVKGSRQPVPVCPCARWCIGSSWWTRCLHSAPLLLRSPQKVERRLSNLCVF